MEVLSAVLVQAHLHLVIFQWALLKLPVGLLFKRGDQPTNHNRKLPAGEDGGPPGRRSRALTAGCLGGKVE